MATTYDNFKRACAIKGTTITQALKAIGRSTSATGSWSHGGVPGLDVCMELATYLGVSLDELVYGEDRSREIETRISRSQQEWLDIVSHIPVERQETCKAFLRTHMVDAQKV